MELVPHTLKQGKSLVVKRRNKTCLVTCPFNENTSLSQVSIPHTPPLPPATQELGDHRPQVGAGRKTESKPCSFREHKDLVQTFKTQGSNLGKESLLGLSCQGDKYTQRETVPHSAASIRKMA